MTVAGHVLKSWSSTQSVVALSSGEAEYFSLVTGASQPIGMRSMLKDLGIEFRVEVKTDANAQICVAARKWVGRIRHLETNRGCSIKWRLAGSKSLRPKSLMNVPQQKGDRGSLVCNKSSDRAWKASPHASITVSDALIFRRIACHAVRVLVRCDPCDNSS